MSPRTHDSEYHVLFADEVRGFQLVHRKQDNELVFTFREQVDLSIGHKLDALGYEISDDERHFKIPYTAEDETQARAMVEWMAGILAKEPKRDIQVTLEMSMDDYRRLEKLLDARPKGAFAEMPSLRFEEFKIMPAAHEPAHAQAKAIEDREWSNRIPRSAPHNRSGNERA